jgi:alkylation response protein AidB-like acyl-CoA dehydrogenase
MDFRLTESQRELQELTAKFCASRYGLNRLARFENAPLDRSEWRELASLGVFALRLPGVDGGLGLGAIEAALVFEQLGRHLVPGPVVWSQLAAPRLPEIGQGGYVVGGIDLVGAEGDPLLVEHAMDLDAMVVLRDDGAFVCERDELDEIEMLVPLDPLTPVGRIARLPAGRRLGDVSVAAGLRQEGAVFAAALLLGISSAALEIARDYALQREQFGRPIATFQAIKHMLADMYVRDALARSATYAAAAVLDDPVVGDDLRAIASAKLLAGEAAMENARACIQIHGGMGYTWEMPPHYLLKRTWVLEQSFGTGAAHALAISASLQREIA